MIRLGLPTYLAHEPRQRFGGGGSSASTSAQTTSNQDNRAAADTGSVSASGGATLSNVSIINQSSDPGVIAAALKSAEQQSAITAGTVNDIAHAAIGENAALSAEAIDKWSEIANDAIGLGATSIQAIASQSANTTQLAAQALSQAQPAQAMLKWVIYGGAAVLIVFFLSRAKP